MPQRADTVLIITCGALAREIHQIRRLNGWTHVDLQAIDANLHMQPSKIAPAVREKLDTWRSHYDTVFVAYADCGTYGALDSVLADYDVERLPGLHCYASFAGQKRFEQLQNDEPGTFYVTDFLVRHFDRLVTQALGLDRHPQLRSAFFGNYRRLVYLAQTGDHELEQRAMAIAQELELGYEHVMTGFGELATELRAVAGG